MQIFFFLRPVHWPFDRFQGKMYVLLIHIRQPGRFKSLTGYLLSTLVVKTNVSLNFNGLKETQ